MTLAFELDQAEFERAAVDCLRGVVYDGLVGVAAAAPEPVREAVERALRSSPEYDSLLAGDLRDLFGVEESQPVVEGVVRAVRDSVAVTASRGTGAVLGVLTVEILRDDYSDVLAVEGAKYVSVSRRRGTSTVVDWLNWLLLAGTSVVVAEWEAKSDRASFAGTRTGGAVMVLPRRRAGRGFQVPPEFSGVSDENWLTRCMAEVQPAVQDVLVRLLEQV